MNFFRYMFVFIYLFFIFSFTYFSFLLRTWLLLNFPLLLDISSFWSAPPPSLFFLSSSLQTLSPSLSSVCQWLSVTSLPLISCYVSHLFAPVCKSPLPITFSFLCSIMLCFHLRLSLFIIHISLSYLVRFFFLHFVLLAFSWFCNCLSFILLPFVYVYCVCTSVFNPLSRSLSVVVSQVVKACFPVTSLASS